MIPPSEMFLIQTTITHKCPFKCCHCSQMCPHQPEPFMMSLEEVENAFQSLEGYPGHWGIFGGEPLLHPDFPEICRLMRKYQPVKARRELWTAGVGWEKHKDVIDETFYRDLIAYNEHEDEQECWHQPLNIAVEEVVDKQLMRDLILNCWVQLRWSASITPMGAYFCEVAAARAMMLGEPEGLPVEKGWWKLPISTYWKQVSELCPKCSACLPMPMKANDKQEYDDVSPLMFEELKRIGSKKPCKVYDIESLREYYKGYTFEPETDYDKRGYFKDFPDWRPNIYRLEKKHQPKC